MISSVFCRSQARSSQLSTIIVKLQIKTQHSKINQNLTYSSKNPAYSEWIERKLESLKIYLNTETNNIPLFSQAAARSRAAVTTEKLAPDTDTDPEKMCPGVRCWSALRSVPTPAPGTDTCYCHEMSRIGSL